MSVEYCYRKLLGCSDREAEDRITDKRKLILELAGAEREKGKTCRLYTCLPIDNELPRRCDWLGSRILQALLSPTGTGIVPGQGQSGLRLTSIS